MPLSESWSKRKAILDRIGAIKIDSGFYKISSKRAGILCRYYGGLPKDGYETLIEFEGYKWWISRTQDTWKTQKEVWSIRAA